MIHVTAGDSALRHPTVLAGTGCLGNDNGAQVLQFRKFLYAIGAPAGKKNNYDMVGLAGDQGAEKRGKCLVGAADPMPGS